MILQIDEGTPTEPIAFRTRLPAGCLVNVPIGADMVAALRTGTALKVQTEADGGQRTGFSISLGGFGSAFDRNSALAQ